MNLRPPGLLAGKLVGSAGPSPAISGLDSSSQQPLTTLSEDESLDGRLLLEQADGFELGALPRNLYRQILPKNQACFIASTQARRP